ncbi:metallophosphoesterase family protein [Planctomycetes bacterium K23_9]|uniref:Putative metallophosphoesterase YhaO n=1 Tax=Stieleria marina TaxID=1930275 RepID=A0A517NYW7_9BACT|nr:putative metallophosphoesterase YhaO [Planctomycetes bacterium K23_9]
MTKRRILHAADIHLDSPLQKLSQYEDAPVQQIRDASRDALNNLTDLAIDQAVDLVVVAGDLYDGNWKETRTGMFFVKQATKLRDAGIPILVIRGNHDAANIMTNSLPLPANPDGSPIMMADEKVDTRVFDDLGIAVHGRSFGKRAEKDGMVKHYPSPHSGMFNLGLLHTSLLGGDGHDPYAPCTPAELTNKEYDYWALGHIHVRGEHGVADGAPIVFSGNIQGRHINETGEKGCILVDIDDKNQTKRTFHPLDVARWELCSIDASEMQSTDDLLEAFGDWLAKQLPQVGDRLLVTRVRVHGNSPLHNKLHQRSRHIEDELRAITISHGEGQTWLETFRVRTNVIADASLSVDMEGPMKSLSHVVGDLKSDPELAAIVATELRNLAGKLPTEVSLCDEIGEDASQWAQELIAAASADLVGRLQGNGQEAGQ